MTETDAKLIELENQRNFMATRAVQLAGELAKVRGAVVERDKTIAEMKAEIEKLSKPGEAVA